MAYPESSFATMIPFLKQVAQYYYSRGGIEKCCFVFPNRRSAVFFRKYLSEEVARSGSACLCPAMMPMNDLFARIGGKTVADRVKLTVRLWRCCEEIVKKKGGTPESLDDFLFWGDMILSDFDDVDKYLVDPERLFTNVADFKALQNPLEYMSENQALALEKFLSHFSTSGVYKESFLKLWEILLPLYESFGASLAEEGLAYEGAVYREVAERLKEESAVDVMGRAFPETGKFVFVGLNALNECEKRLMRRLRDAGAAEFCWDYSSEMIKDPANKSSFFLSSNVLEFPQAFRPDPEGLPVPEISVLSVPSAAGQAKQLEGIFREMGAGVPGIETAVVLPDEAQLIGVLNSLPGEIGEINVTMGYPLKESGMNDLLGNLGSLQMHLREKDGTWFFYGKQVRAIFSGSVFRAILSETENKTAEGILEEPRYYIPASEFEGAGLLSTVFRPVLKSPSKASAAECEALGGYLRECVAAIGLRLGKGGDMAFEKDFAKTFHEMLGRLLAEKLEVKPQTWLRLLSKMVSGAAVPFLGEPLRGLQIMGPLETRSLDFRNVVVLGCNEGLFPRRNVASSFIPAELRKGFDLPTYEYQDAVWAYYFYRLIQRAEKVWLVFDSRTDVSRSGEESRYIKQLEMHFGVRTRRLVFDAPLASSEDVPAIPKTEEDVAAIRAGRLSASALQKYLCCPARFYYSTVKGLREQDEISEGLDAGMIGNVFHKTMNILYGRDSVPDGKIRKEYLEALLKDGSRIKEVVRPLIMEEVRALDISGRNILYEEMICRFVRKVLEKDLALTGSSDGFEILGTEMPFYGTIDGFRFIGIVDRLDSIVPGTVRIVDYKTGKVTDDDFLIDEENAEEVVSKVFGPDNAKRPKIALQLYLYDELVRGDRNLSEKIGGAAMVNSIYQTSRLFVSGVSEVALCGKFCSLMKDGVSNLLAEIGDLSVPFERRGDEKTCGWCEFKNICGR